MNKLPKGFILKILDHFNIQYKVYNKTIKVKCPFHDDNNPSASVNLEKNTFICFVCENKLYKKLGIESDKRAISAKNLYNLLSNNNKQEWTALVKNSYKNSSELQKNISLIKKNNLSNVNLLDVWNSLSEKPNKKTHKYLKDRKINLEKLSKKEIKFINSGKYSKWSIALPMFNTKKELTGIQLKAPDNITNPKTISYPGGSLGFFGLNSLQENKITFFVEGVADFLTAKSLGLRNVIGISTALQPIPESIVDFISETAIFFLHNDESGKNLYQKIKEICNKNGIYIIAVRTSKEPGGDLNNFITKHKNSKVILKNYLIKLLKGERK